MTYQELINNIRDLGFSDDDEMEEFGELVPNSINRAITELNLSIAPIIKKYEYDITGVDDGFLYITMPDVDDLFLDFADTPVLYAETTPYKSDGEIKTKEVSRYDIFSDYDIEANDTIVIDLNKFNKSVPDPEKDPEAYALAAKKTYSIKIFYKAEHERFTGVGSQLPTELPLPRKVHHLVPLLAAYYVWLEDEPVKAAQYFNAYEQKAQEVLANSQSSHIKIRVLSGGI